MSSSPTDHPALAAAGEPVLAAITIMGSGRLGPTVTALAGGVGVVLAARAWSHRRARTTTARREAVAAVTLGTISVVLGALFLVTADGGPGTGNGVVASVLAVVLGPAAIVLAGLGRARRHLVGPVLPDAPPGQGPSSPQRTGGAGFGNDGAVP